MHDCGSNSPRLATFPRHAQCNVLLSGSDDKRILVWDLYAHSLIHALEGHATSGDATALRSKDWRVSYLCQIIAKSFHHDAIFTKNQTQYDTMVDYQRHLQFM